MSTMQESNANPSGETGESDPGDVARRLRDRIERTANARAERERRAHARIEERLARARAAHEEREQRAREWLEAKLLQVQTDHEQRGQRVRNGRERILAAAQSLFLVNGYMATSMQEIAEAADLRKASIYHHFKDKEALFSEIVLEEITKWSANLHAVVTRDEPLRGSLYELALAQMRMTQNDDGRLFVEFQKHVPEERHAEVHAMLQAWVGDFAVLFERALERNEIGAIDPRVAALFFFHMGAAWTFHGIEDPSLLPDDPAAAARTIVNVLLNGLTGGLTTPA